jgi:hypothetical protein
MTLRKLAVAATVAVAFGGAAGAQAPGASSSPSAADKGKSADAAVQLYTIPESPAFTFLDLTPAKITKPTTTRDFVTSLINAIDESGHVRQGVALEVEGSRVLGKQPSLAQYQQRGMAAIVARSQLSFATVRAAGDSTSTDLSYGLRIPFFDAGDPMADPAFTTGLIEAFRKCAKVKPPLPNRSVSNIKDTAAKAALSELLEASSREHDSTAIVEQKKCAGEAIKANGDAYAKSHWNAANFSVAYAGGHHLVTSVATGTRELGYRVWAVGGIPILGEAGQLLGMVQYANLVPSPESGHQTSLRYGVRSTIGQPTLNGFLELFRERRTPKGLPSVNRDGWSGGVEFRISEELWLATGFGRANELKGSPTMVVANLKWGLSNQAQLARQ